MALDLDASERPSGSAAIEIAEGLWLLEGETVPFFAPPLPLRLPYRTRSVAARLEDGTLWIDSPVRLTDAIRAAVDALGPVHHIVSPNKLHHLFIDDWRRAYPHARLYAPPGLEAKRPDLDFTAALGDAPEAAWAADLDQLIFAGSIYMQEVVFFHRASRTLILGDLIENHDPADLTRAQRALARFNRMLAPCGETPRNFRASFWRREAARRSLARLMAWEPERIVPLHGPWIERDAVAFLERAFAWLAPRR